MKQKVAIIGGGIGGVMAAIRLRTLGYNVDIYEKNILFSGTTRNVTELHASGFEYSSNPNDLSSAEACIKGGIEFLQLFGENGLELLQNWGVLEKNRTTFELTQSTHEHTNLTWENLEESSQLLTKFYQEYTQDKKAPVSAEIFVEPLEPSNEEMEKREIKAGVRVAQWGVNIARLGAILRQNLTDSGVRIYEKTEVTCVSENPTGFSLAFKDSPSQTYNIAVYATNLDILSLLTGSQQKILSIFEKLKIHQRLQVFVECDITDLPEESKEKITGHPRYTYSATNLGDKDKNWPFDGTMQDIISVRTDENGRKIALLALYAAGPADADAIGGGSWGKTGEMADEKGEFKEFNVWRDKKWPDDPEINHMVEKVLASVKKWNPWLSECPLTVKAVSVSGTGTVNNVSSERSNIGVHQLGETAQFTIMNTKFTQAAFNSLELAHQLIQLSQKQGISTHEKAEELSALTQGLLLPIPPKYTSNPHALTVDACGLAKNIGLPEEAGLPKNGGIDLKRYPQDLVRTAIKEGIGI